MSEKPLTERLTGVADILDQYCRTEAAETCREAANGIEQLKTDVASLDNIIEQFQEERAGMLEHFGAKLLADEAEAERWRKEYLNAAKDCTEFAGQVEALTKALARLRTSAALLQASAEGCAVNHYGEDFSLHGMPGWLADTAKDIESAAALASSPPESSAQVQRDMAGETVCGFRVAAYRETHPEHGAKYGHRYSEHWSTPSQNPAVTVERLFTEAQLREALARPAPAEARSEQPGWRPISDHPGQGAECLFWWPGAKRPYAGAATEADQIWKAEGSCFSLQRATHWMPLPAPPKAEAE